ncbi:MAG TPA: PAS domain S-box protein [Gemmatimonadales bacterium]|nr:PAS domain S-box protein [Gemmatimonadales bacterium]
MTDQPAREATPAVPEESTEELYDDAPCGYVTTWPDGTIVRVNRTLALWTAYSRKALLSSGRFQDLLTVPSRIFYETHVALLLGARGQVKEVALDLLRQDGTTLPVLLNSVQRQDAAGRPVSIRTTLMDMTERRRYERELLAAGRRMEQLATVVNASADAIVTTAPDGTIQTWNRGAERLFGWRADEVVGRLARDLLVPPDRMAEHEGILDELRARREVRLETVRNDRAGRPIDVSMTLTPHEEALGEVVAVSSIIRDVSERRRVESERRRAEQLQIVGTLAGGVAHEVNNQMTAVLGYGEFVRRALGADHPQLPDIRDMLAAAARAASISKQLLAFSRRQLIDPRVLDLHQVATDLASTLSRLLGSDKELVIEPNRAARQIRADPTQIEQILINLAANARDAMVTGGRLTVSTRDATVGEAEIRAHPADDVAPGPYVLLSVSDTGSGMDVETLAHIFEPFFTTKPVGQGTGLGLSMVHGIVKQHGGQIWAWSTPGEGTTFHIYLPSVDQAAAADAAPVADTPALDPAPRAAVLVVEDEPVVRRLTRRSLEEVGITVAEAENGRRAWEMLSTSPDPPELVLTDVVMPDMNGRQLGDAIHQRWPGMPVLYTSAYPGSDMRARGMLPSDAPFIQKPFTPDELVFRVSELLREARRAP